MKTVIEKLRFGASRTARFFYDRLELDGGACVRAAESESALKLERATVIALSRRFVIGFILSLGKMAFGTYPLALALVSVSGKYAPVVALGAALGTLISGAPKIYVFSYLVSLLLRLSLSFFLVEAKESFIPRAKCALSAAFSENLYLRVALSVAPAFICGAYTAITGGFYLYDLAGLLFLCVVVPVATFVFAGESGSAKNDGIFSSVAFGALVFSSVFALRGISILGLSVGISAAFFVSIYAAFELGIVRGSLAALAAGFAIAPIYSPIFALVGVVAASLKSTSTKIASAAAAVFAAAFGSFLVGISALTSLFPASALGSILFAFADSACLLPHYRTRARAAASPDMSEIKAKSLIGELGELSESFTVISQIFYNLADGTRTPSVSEMRSICDSVCDNYCQSCASASLCWGREYVSSADMLTSIATELHKRGRASEKSVPEHMRVRCASMGAILGDINRDAARTMGDRIARERAEVVALDYEAFASILSEALAIVEREHELDAGLSARIFSTLDKKRDELDFSSVIVWGKGDKEVRICGTKLHSLGKSSAALKKFLENLLALRISEPTVEVDGDGLAIAFRILPVWECEYANALCSARGGECGDSAVAFEGRYGQFYSLIGDGMGSGSVAALTSRLCAVYLERLLSAGIPAEKAIRILNSLIRAKSIECSSTVDLAEIDQSEGRLSFYKSGAAPSYIRRKGKLFMIASKTVPIGIMRACDAEQISFELEDGDVIIMLSDGVCDDFEECAWLPGLLTDGWEDDLDIMANKLVREATVRAEKKDDISVGIIRVKKQGEKSF